MKLSLKWIKQYADVPVDALTYESKMIMSGTGVEGVEEVAGDVSGVVVGRVIECKNHENSDHLHVCKVDVGAEEPLQIVCGAPNVKEGILVPVAMIGAKLPGGVEIKKGKLRGVESCGMLCASTELGVPQELYPSVGDEGLLIFNEEYPLGADVKPILGIDDTIVDFEILANRPDCMCVWGVARETAAAMNTTFKMPEISVTEAGGDIHDYAKVDVEEQTLCPRYAARVVKNVRIGPSPMWLRSYLNTCGMRSINNIVDITNYIMLETGHPMHAFDLDKVKGRHIIVRKAHENENLRTLDGKDHAMTGNELVICDEGGPTGLAGIMGGEESEITENTKEILFECATFDRATTRIAARGLGIRTESSGRFERGVSEKTILTALSRACQMVNELDAGDVVSGLIDIYPNPQENAVITASCKRIAARAGVDIAPEEMVQHLEKLFFKVQRDGDALTVTVPDFRQDVDGEADLCEEVLRLAGYDRIPVTRLRGETTHGGLSVLMSRQRAIRKLLSGLGLYEVTNYSFLAQKSIDLLGLPADDPRNKPLYIRNPLGEDSACMRTTLIPGMLQVLSLNQNRANASAWLYELGTAFDAQKRLPTGQPTEIPMLCVGMYGQNADFFTLRGVVTALLTHLGVSGINVMPGGEAYMHPGRCCTLLCGNQTLCTLGEVHPDAAERFDLSQRTYVCEISLDTLYRFAKPLDTVKALPRTPAVSRDIALVMADAQPVGPVMTAMTKACGHMLEDIRMFDVYRGVQLGEDKKSVAFSLTFRAPDHTLTENEINSMMEKAQRAVKSQFDAVIRS